MENGEKQQREAMISEPEVEARPPPRRISDAPSARGLKPRRVSAVRHWPPRCGRFRSPPTPAINPSPRQELSRSSSNLMTPILPPVTVSDSDARGYVKRMLHVFQKEYSLLEKAENGFQSKSNPIYRIDLEAMKNVKKSSEYVKQDPFVGHVPGVEVGDEFLYRAELHLIGLHCPSQSGIGCTKINDIPVATSVVESGGYSDRMDGPDVLIYTGSGGQPTGKKGQKTLPQDQKLKGGNRALKNSMDMKKPVRVIRGLNIGRSGKPEMKFTYDGLYMVEGFKYVPEKYKVDGKEYTAKVFKFKMRRIRIQPEVGLHVATMSNKSEVREGLCVANISQGKKKKTGGDAMHHVSRPGRPHQGG